MVYDINTVPEDTALWCAGFCFDDPESSHMPVFGILEKRNSRSKFCVLNNKTIFRTFNIGANPDYYRFADTYEEIATEYNKMIFAAKYELMKKQLYLDRCLLADKNGSVYGDVNIQ